MIRFIKLAYPLLKELFIDKKEQLNFYSAQFNAVRWLQFSATLVLLVLLVLSDRALLRLSYRHVQQSLHLQQLQESHTRDQAEILQLQEIQLMISEDLRRHVDLLAECQKSNSKQTTKTRP